MSCYLKEKWRSTFSNRHALFKYVYAKVKIQIRNIILIVKYVRAWRVDV